MKIRKTLGNNIIVIKKNILPLCQCGCGLRVSKIKNKYIIGHHGRGKIQSEETKQKISNSHKGKSSGMLGKSAWNKGKKTLSEIILKLKKSHLGEKHTKEHIEKVIKANIGKKRTPEQCKRISEGKIGKKRKSCSDETRKKLSISTIKYQTSHPSNSGYITPTIGKNEILILNRLYNGINRQTLRNDRELYKKCRKFPDNYDINYNLVIDVLEDHHFKSNNELSDSDHKRQAIIANKLACMIYYIPEQEFLSNPEKEIQRFKDFILLLDKGPN